MWGRVWSENVTEFKTSVWFMWFSVWCGTCTLVCLGNLTMRYVPLCQGLCFFRTGFTLTFCTYEINTYTHRTPDAGLPGGTLWEQTAAYGGGSDVRITELIAESLLCWNTEHQPVSHPLTTRHCALKDIRDKTFTHDHRDNGLGRWRLVCVVSSHTIIL